MHLESSIVPSSNEETFKNAHVTNIRTQSIVRSILQYLLTLQDILACEAIGQIMRSVLGPKSMEKLLFEDGTTVITNDGATILSKLVYLIYVVV
jgi:hypothetical protein